MSINTATISGIVSLPNDTVPDAGSYIEFTLSGFDTDDGTVLPNSLAVRFNNDGTFVTELWPNAAGVRGTRYDVAVFVGSPLPYQRFNLGSIIVPNDGAFDLDELLAIEPPTDAGVDEYIVQLAASASEAEVAASVATLAADAAENSASIASSAASVSSDAAQISAQEAAVSAATSTANATSASTSASTSTLAAQAAGAPLFASLSDGETATSVGDVFMVQTEPATAVYQNVSGSGAFLGWLGEILFDSTAGLISSTLTGFLDGQFIRTRAEGFSYQVAANAASDHHVTTAGGVKLYVLESAYGYPLLAFGTVTAASFTKALTTASLTDAWLHAPDGTYDLSGITTLEPTGDIRIRGAGQNTVFTGAGEKLSVLAEGKSAVLRDVAFDGFACVVETPSIDAGVRFPLLEIIGCKFTDIDNSAFWNYSGDVPQGVDVLRFEGNKVLGVGKADGSCAGLGCRSSSIRSSFVLNNEIEDVGGDFSGKAYGIVIGALMLGDETSTLIEGNRIRNVSNNSDHEMNGILTFGRSARVINNSVQEIVSTDPANNDQEGIYVKASYSVIMGNTCINAGGAEGTIILKGQQPGGSGSSFGHDNIVANNTILIDDDRTNRAGISVLPVDRIKIHGNIINGTDKGIGISEGNDLVEIYDNRILNSQNPNNGPVVGITIGSVKNVVVKNNLLKDIGLLTNSNSNGIYNSGPTATDLETCIIEGNVIDKVNGVGACYGIRLKFNAGSTGKLLSVCGNSVANSDYGLQFSNAGGWDTMRLCNNSEVNSGNGIAMLYGTPMPAAMQVSGNTFEGLPYINHAQSTSANFSQGCFDEYRLTAASPVTIGTFTRMTDGRKWSLVLEDGNISINNNSLIKTADNQVWSPANGGIIHFHMVDGIAYETSRFEF